MMLAMKSRWTADDGRSWPYDGQSFARLSDIPADVRQAAKEMIITDHLLRQRFQVTADHSITVWID